MLVIATLAAELDVGESFAYRPGVIVIRACGPSVGVANLIWSPVELLAEGIVKSTSVLRIIPFLETGPNNRPLTVKLKSEQKITSQGLFH